MKQSCTMSCPGRHWTVFLWGDIEKDFLLGLIKRFSMLYFGVVSHPSEWTWSGYNEIQNQKQRYAIINYKRLTELLGLGSVKMLKGAHAEWVEESLKADRHERDRKWSQAIAVGSEDYIEHIKKDLGMKVIYRKTNQVIEGFELREDQFSYNTDFDPQNAGLSHNNSYLWSVYQ